MPPLLTDFLAPKQFDQFPMLGGILPAGRVPDHLPFLQDSRMHRMCVFVCVRA